MRRAEILFIETRECDCCDQERSCASISLGITNFVWIICDECLKDFLNEFEI